MPVLHWNLEAVDEQAHLEGEVTERLGSNLSPALASVTLSKLHHSVALMLHLWKAGYRIKWDDACDLV